MLLQPGGKVADDARPCLAVGVLGPHLVIPRFIVVAFTFLATLGKVHLLGNRVKELLAYCDRRLLLEVKDFNVL